MPEKSHGTTIAFATGFFAEVLSVSQSGISREPIETTHMGTTDWRTFIPSALSDGGELTVELQFIPGTAAPIGNAAEAITVTFSDAGAAVWAFTGFMTSFDWSAPDDNGSGKMTATATIKVTGAITVTP